MADQPKVPRHIAIIMDGNNRWAKKRLLGGIAGHKAGRDAVRVIVEGCAKVGVEALTLFAFSSENWRRPQEEVSALMELFMVALKQEVKKLHRNNIRFKVIGELGAFSKGIQKLIADAEELTKDNTGLNLNIAANYGGRWDITEAAKILAKKVKNGELDPDEITPEMMDSNVCLSQLPDPDLCIRTAGEQRISNFLLWQFAYSEFYYTDVYWPDFREEELQKALDAYAGRTRRFGRTDDQIATMKEAPCSLNE